MMPVPGTKGVGIASILLLLFTGAHANLITNGNFETGTFAGWTTFTTSEGVIGTSTTPGSPQVTLFDTDGDSTATNSAQFSVARDTFTAGSQQGGGIFQEFLSAAGLASISLDIAVDRVAGAVTNAEGGVSSLILDGITLDSFTAGSTGSGETVRGSLSATTPLTAGTHELRILITRPYAASDFPLAQYVDNLVVDGPAAVAGLASVPEPAVAALLVLGLAGVGYQRQRKPVS